MALIRYLTLVLKFVMFSSLCVLLIPVKTDCHTSSVTACERVPLGLHDDTRPAADVSESYGMLSAAQSSRDQIQLG